MPGSETWIITDTTIAMYYQSNRSTPRQRDMCVHVLLLVSNTYVLWSTAQYFFALFPPTTTTADSTRLGTKTTAITLSTGKHTEQVKPREVTISITNSFTIWQPFFVKAFAWAVKLSAMALASLPRSRVALAACSVTVVAAAATTPAK